MQGIGERAPDWEYAGGMGTSRRAARPSRRSGGASTEIMRIFSFPPFEDRRDAGRRLAGKLSRFQGERPVVFALPRGGACRV